MSKKGVAFEKGDGSDSEGDMEFAPGAVQFEDPSEFIAKLSQPVQTRVYALQHLQTEHETIQREYQREVEEILKKYEARWQPLYQRRAEIVNGKELTAEENAKAEEVKAKAVKTEEAKTESNNNTEEDKGIPNFWLRVLRNNDIVGENVTERDEEALAFLTDVRSTDFEVKDEDGKVKEKGFKLEFEFASNPFFSNTVLTKTYHMTDDGTGYDFDRAEGCTINWSEGKNLTVKTVKKKQKHKSGKGTRVVEKTEPCDSFFNFFAPPQKPEENDEDADDEELDQILELIDADFEIGQTISERLIKDAVNYYTGARLAELLSEYANYDMGGDDDDEDEDEDEQEEAKPKKGKKQQAPAQGNATGGAEGQDKPECKTQ